MKQNQAIDLAFLHDIIHAEIEQQQLFTEQYQSALMQLKADWEIFKAEREKIKMTNPLLPNHLPNAKQNHPYEYKMPDNMPNNMVVQFEPECGLQFDTTQNDPPNKIIGTPHIHGDVLIHWYQQSALVGSSKLYINPDPKTLWKNLPSNPNARFYKPDAAHECQQSALACSVAARIRGRSHANHGGFCDDDFALVQHELAYGLCVSDGAGSAEFARYGSQLAVGAAAQSLLAWLQDEQSALLWQQYEPEQQRSHCRNLVIAAARQAYAAHYQAQEREQVSLKSLSATLLIVVTLPLKTGAWLTSSYWVGDGAMAILDPATESIQLLGVGDTGQYAGETSFLSAKEVQDEAVSWRVQQFETESMPLLLVMSDGVSDPYFETEAQMAKLGAWQALWQDLQPVLQAENPAQALELWLNFEAKGHYDDRTLALLIPNQWLVQETGQETGSRSGR